MKHAATQALYRYWDSIRGDRLAPDRAEIDPTAIKGVLADTFILEIDGAGRFPFRLAGTRVCALFGRELKDFSFAELWSGQQGAMLVRSVCDEAQGAVAGVLGARVRNAEMELELLLLPLRHRGKTHARVLGCISTASLGGWFGLTPVDTLVLRSFRVIHGRVSAGALPEPANSVVAQRRGQLTVLEGGRTA